MFYLDLVSQKTPPYLENLPNRRGFVVENCRIVNVKQIKQRNQFYLLA